MKKFMKSFIKTLSLIFVVAFASLPFIGCSNKSANKNTDSPALENIADTGNEEESSENVSTEEETPVATEIKELNGIYKMARTIGYKDTWFEKQEDAIKFFNTKDINGVYNALRVLDFSKYYNNFVIFFINFDYIAIVILRKI